MKYLLSLLLIFLTLNSKADYWTRKADFPNGARAEAFGFSIGSKGYVGGGLNMLTSLTVNDFWEYDPGTDTWAQKTNFPGGGTAYCVSFSIGTKGYVCTGMSIYNTSAYNDLWEYDPTADTWTKKTSFPGDARSLAVGFIIDSLGYVGTGYGDSTSSYAGFTDFYAYNQTTNSWNTIAQIPSLPSFEGVAFSVLSSGYVTGQSLNGSMSDSLWKYNSLTNSWSAKANFPDTARCDAAAFSINNLGYFGMGDMGGNHLFNDFWQYNPITNTWTQKTSLPSTTRDETSHFVIGSKGYICFGGENFNSELWEYTPDGVGVEPVNNQKLSIQVYPNPFSKTTKLYFSRELQNAELSILDIYGKKVGVYSNIQGREFLLNRNDLSSGLYFYRISENGILIAKDKLLVQ